MEEEIFVRTMSVEAFKNELQCNEIQVIKNPNTGKLFFVTDNGASGKVSTKFEDISSEAKSISKCKDKNGEEFWMLHKQNQENTVLVL